ncbi:DNA primase [Candidatus Pacearchaeota archaeon]|nr:DNA primase [Candidatus Pacearchaeota archaeon]
MAKVSPVSIKYMIYASFKAEGPLERPDVIGAIFGQTEGLLGSDLEMRELQKEGKIGRIEVELEIVDGKSVGEIQIPTALDKSGTTLVAAALETIDRIGPTEAQIEIRKIEDVRGNKRAYIMERAKKLLSGIDQPESFKEISQSLKEDTRVEKIQEYGDERLPAGDISGNEIIVVEGRADVVNLLRNRVNNVIGMNGTKMPMAIAELGKEKEITLFVDGDRGGKLIAGNVINHAKVTFVATAPEGKEVEELTGKEILMSLRKRVPVREYLARGNGFVADEDNGIRKSAAEETEKIDEGNVKEKLREIYEKIRGEKAALLLDNNFDVIRKVGNKEIIKNIENSKKRIFAIVAEGTAGASLIRVCDEYNVSYLAAMNFSSVEGAKVKLVSL